MCYFLLNMAPFFAGATLKMNTVWEKRMVAFRFLHFKHLIYPEQSTLGHSRVILWLEESESLKRKTIREQIFSVKKVVRILPHFGWQNAYTLLKRNSHQILASDLSHRAVFYFNQNARLWVPIYASAGNTFRYSIAFHLWDNRLLREIFLLQFLSHHTDATIDA